MFKILLELYEAALSLQRQLSLLCFIDPLEKEADGDGYLVNIVDMNTSDAYQALERIDVYLKNNGGTYTRTEPIPSEEK